MINGIHDEPNDQGRDLELTQALLFTSSTKTRTAELHLISDEVSAGGMTRAGTSDNIMLISQTYRWNHRVRHYTSSLLPLHITRIETRDERPLTACAHSCGQNMETGIWDLW